MKMVLGYTNVRKIENTLLALGDGGSLCVNWLLYPVDDRGIPALRSWRWPKTQHSTPGQMRSKAVAVTYNHSLWEGGRLPCTEGPYGVALRDVVNNY